MFSLGGQGLNLLLPGCTAHFLLPSIALWFLLPSTFLFAKYSQGSHKICSRRSSGESTMHMGACK